MQIFQSDELACPGNLGRELVMAILPDVGYLAVQASQFHLGLLAILIFTRIYGNPKA
jgi:hypothetical protein